MGSKLGHYSKMLAEALTIARVKRDLTQEQLADRLGLRQAISVSKWESAKAPVPLAHLYGLNGVLGLPLELLYNVARECEPEVTGSLTGIAQHGGVGVGNDNRIDMTPIDKLHGKYPSISREDLMSAALAYYGERAEKGLDANLKPLQWNADERKKAANGRA